MSLINEPCMIKCNLVNINPFERNYYTFMFRLDKSNQRCNVSDDLSTNICVPSQTKYVKIKLYNVITKGNEAKTLVKSTSCNSYYIRQNSM